MIIYVDIDGTLCVASSDLDYTKAEPINNNIEAVNALYDSGHTIVIWTARGTVNNNSEIALATRQQLDLWGVCYHELKFGKPFFDYLFDDRALQPNHLESLVELLS